MLKKYQCSNFNSILKTRFRLMAVIFCFVMLTFFGAVPFYVFTKNAKNGTLGFNVASVAALVLLLLFLGGIIAIIKWAKVITMDKSKDLFVILHPFLLQKRKYRFNEVLGFQWAYVTGKVTYKSLKIKTFDGKIYQFLDFEVSNFREVESFISQNFSLRFGKNWQEATKKQRLLEEQISREFDLEQAKEIRWNLRLGIVALLFLVLFQFYEVIRKDLSFESFNYVFLLSLSIGCLGMLVKLKDINARLESYQSTEHVA